MKTFALLAACALLAPAVDPNFGVAAPGGQRLPTSVHGRSVADRAVTLHVHPDGSVTAGEDELFSPKSAQNTVALQSWLRAAVAEMETEELATGVEAPAGTLLIRADAMAPFSSVQAVMETCGGKDVMLWRIEFAVATSDGSSLFRATDGPGRRLKAHLPVDVEGHPGGGGTRLGHGPAEEPIEVKMVVQDPGKWTPAPAEGAEHDPTDPRAPFVYDASRELSLRVGPFKTKEFATLAERLKKLVSANMFDSMTIDASEGVTHGEVVRVMNAGLNAGFKTITFTGRRR